MTKRAEGVTALLSKYQLGDREAADKLLPLVYEDLRRIARAQMSRQDRGHTLSPTALVHEAFLRMEKSEGLALHDRKHFFRAASQCMKWLLVDYARAKRSEKRGGPGQIHVTFDEKLHAIEGQGVEIETLVEALDLLAQQDPRMAEIVELRFLGGLALEEIASLTNLSLTTVKRDLAMAKMWLRRQLSEAEDGGR